MDETDSEYSNNSQEEDESVEDKEIMPPEDNTVAELGSNHVPDDAEPIVDKEEEAVEVENVDETREEEKKSDDDDMQGEMHGSIDFKMFATMGDSKSTSLFGTPGLQSAKRYLVSYDDEMLEKEETPCFSLGVNKQSKKDLIVDMTGMNAFFMYAANPFMNTLLSLKNEKGYEYATQFHLKRHSKDLDDVIGFWQVILRTTASNVTKRAFWHGCNENRVWFSKDMDILIKRIICKCLCSCQRSIRYDGVSHDMFRS